MRDQLNATASISDWILTDEERGDLVAFLEALSSERPPKPSTEIWIGRPAAPAPVVTATATSMISQRDKTFRPGAVRVAAGSSIQIVNDDTRTHNVRIVDPRLTINSGAQDPGESVTLKFEGKGHFEAHCGIHPTMRLSIDVE